MLAILGSLGAIYFQMKQQARITGTEIIRSTSERAQSILGELGKDAELARLIRVSASHWDALSENRKLAASTFWWQWVQVGEDMYYQAQSTSFSDSTQYADDMYRAIVGSLRMPGVRQWWSIQQVGMAPDFVAMINNLLEHDEEDASSWYDLAGWAVGEDDVARVVAQESDA